MEEVPIWGLFLKKKNHQPGLKHNRQTTPKKKSSSRENPSANNNNIAGGPRKGKGVPSKNILQDEHINLLYTSTIYFFGCWACNRTHKLLTNFSKNGFYFPRGPLGAENFNELL